MKATTLGGIQIEPGMDVILDSITLQRDPAVWGEDSSEFKPERFVLIKVCNS
jgi:cytochrome P450